MPTSVGPKTYGKDNLVFGYDTGDTKNSYKGEPTENLVDAFPDTSLPSGFHFTYEFSASIHDAPVSNHEFSNKKWIKFTKTKATNGRVMFTNGSFTSGSQYTWSCYVYCNDSRLTALYHGSDNGAYSQRTSFKQYDFNKLGTVQRLYGTWNQLQNAGSVFGMRAGSTNPLSSSFFMTGLQVEEKGHMTPVIDGERSANSGSILDLANNSTVDVTNVSFDSDAQPTWDGVNDYINIPAGDWNKVTSVTMEVVVQVYGTPIDGNAYHVVAQKNGGYSGAPVYGIRLSDTNVPRGNYSRDASSAGQQKDTVYGTAMTANKYYHLVYTREVGKSVMYQNGVATDINTGDTGSIFDNSNTITVGVGDGRQLYGDVPYFKLYDRVLNASEVSENYLAVKNRFNIE